MIINRPACKLIAPGRATEKSGLISDGTPVDVGPSVQQLENSDTQPIGLDKTLELLRQLKSSTPMRTEAKAAPQPQFHSPPEAQADLMRNNHTSMKRVKETYQGIDLRRQEALKTQADIYKNLQDSLSQIWTRTRGLG